MRAILRVLNLHTLHTNIKYYIDLEDTNLGH
jgi:hypothetical protein